MVMELLGNAPSPSPATPSLTNVCKIGEDSPSREEDSPLRDISNEFRSGAVSHAAALAGTLAAQPPLDHAGNCCSPAGAALQAEERVLLVLADGAPVPARSGLDSVLTRPPTADLQALRAALDAYLDGAGGHRARLLAAGVSRDRALAYVLADYVSAAFPDAGDAKDCGRLVNAHLTKVSAKETALDKAEKQAVRGAERLAEGGKSEEAEAKRRGAAQARSQGLLQLHAVDYLPPQLTPRTSHKRQRLQGPSPLVPPLATPSTHSTTTTTATAASVLPSERSVWRQAMASATEAGLARARDQVAFWQQEVERLEAESIRTAVFKERITEPDLGRSLPVRTEVELTADRAVLYGVIQRLEERCESLQCKACERISLNRQIEGSGLSGMCCGECHFPMCRHIHEYYKEADQHMWMQNSELEHWQEGFDGNALYSGEESERSVEPTLRVQTVCCAQLEHMHTARCVRSKRVA